MSLRSKRCRLGRTNLGRSDEADTSVDSRASAVPKPQAESPAKAASTFPAKIDQNADGGLADSWRQHSAVAERRGISARYLAACPLTKQGSLRWEEKRQRASNRHRAGLVSLSRRSGRAPSFVDCSVITFAAPP